MNKAKANGQGGDHGLVGSLIQAAATQEVRNRSGSLSTFAETGTTKGQAHDSADDAEYAEFVPGMGELFEQEVEGFFSWTLSYATWQAAGNLHPGRGRGGKWSI
ncbi:hypothetical protein RUND412_008352 [Rhizina undulata]